MSCALSKVRRKILFHRNQSVTESKLLGLLSGLHSGSSTTEQIMTLRSSYMLSEHKNVICPLFSLTIAKPSIQWTEGNSGHP